MTSDSTEKKLFVDEDWKSQVEREKQAAAAHTPPIPTAGATSAAPTAAAPHTAVPHTATPASEPAPAEKPAAPTRELPLPPASFTFLITTLATQALVSLGEAPNPLTNRIERRPDQAKHFIDTLAMLEQKTEGNRTPEESSLLRGILHQLRLSFLAGPPESPRPSGPAGAA